MTALDAMEKVLRAVRPERLLPNNERELQERISKILNAAGMLHEREKVLTDKERLDFYLPDSGLCIEVKMLINASALIRQVRRYIALPEVSGVVVIAPMPGDFSDITFAKPVWQIPIWKQML